VPRIRPAELRDCPRITEITNAEIESGVAHFATTPDNPDAVADAWRRDLAVYPWLVAVDDVKDDSAAAAPVLGFARAARWKTREAYDWTCESAVYVDPAARGRGIGRALYRALFAELERRGFRCIVAGVVTPNPASERLHESLGMSDAGTLTDVGFKHGRWRAVRYYTRQLGGDAPPGPSPITGLPPTDEPGPR